MQEYKLVNPVIFGNFDTTIKAGSVNNAANELWNNLSKYCSGIVGRFGFSLEKKSNGKINHFIVSEGINTNPHDVTVNYTIERLVKQNNKVDKNNIGIVSKGFTDFITKNQKLQAGGFFTQKSLLSENNENSSESGIYLKDDSEEIMEGGKKKILNQLRKMIVWKVVKKMMMMMMMTN